MAASESYWALSSWLARLLIHNSRTKIIQTKKEFTQSKLEKHTKKKKKEYIKKFQFNNKKWSVV